MCVDQQPPLTSISQRGANHSVLASTKASSSSLRHMPKPTMLKEVEKDASILHLYLPGAGFFQTSSSCLDGWTCGVVDWVLLLDLILWVVRHSSNTWVARWNTCGRSQVVASKVSSFYIFIDSTWLMPSAHIALQVNSVEPWKWEHWYYNLDELPCQLCPINSHSAILAQL